MARKHTKRRYVAFASVPQQELPPLQAPSSPEQPAADIPGLIQAVSSNSPPALEAFIGQMVTSVGGRVLDQKGLTLFSQTWSQAVRAQNFDVMRTRQTYEDMLQQIRCDAHVVMGGWVTMQQGPTGAPELGANAPLTDNGFQAVVNSDRPMEVDQNGESLGIGSISDNMVSTIRREVQTAQTPPPAATTCLMPTTPAPTATMATVAPASQLSCWSESESKSPGRVTLPDDAAASPRQLEVTLVEAPKAPGLSPGIAETSGDKLKVKDRDGADGEDSGNETDSTNGSDEKELEATTARTSVVNFTSGVCEIVHFNDSDEEGTEAGAGASSDVAADEVDQYDLDWSAVKAPRRSVCFGEVEVHTHEVLEPMEWFRLQEVGDRVAMDADPTCTGTIVRVASTGKKFPTLVQFDNQDSPVAVDLEDLHRLGGLSAVSAQAGSLEEASLEADVPMEEEAEPVEVRRTRRQRRQVRAGPRRETRSGRKRRRSEKEAMARKRRHHEALEDQADGKSKKRRMMKWLKMGMQEFQCSSLEVMSTLEELRQLEQ